MPSIASSPEKSFSDWLDTHVHKSWIRGFQWAHANSLQGVRDHFGRPCPSGFSRTHKRVARGDQWWGLEVQAGPNLRVGIDLEWFSGPGHFKDPEAMAERLELEPKTDERVLLEEWVCREAAFKAISDHGATGENLTLSQLRRTGVGEIRTVGYSPERVLEVDLQWDGPWLLGLACLRS